MQLKKMLNSVPSCYLGEEASCQGPVAEDSQGHHEEAEEDSQGHHEEAEEDNQDRDEVEEDNQDRDVEVEDVQGHGEKEDVQDHHDEEVEEEPLLTKYIYEKIRKNTFQ